MGERSRWLRKIRVDMNAPADRVISGEKIQLIDSIDAFGKSSLSWIIRGKGDVSIKAGAPHVGFINATFKL